MSAAIACNDEITGLGPPSDPATETFAPALGVNIAQMTRLPSGVYIEDLIDGTGDSVTARTDTLRVTYSGFIKTGDMFDSGTNVEFQPAFLVPGFRDGLQGMRVGGRRRIVIPSALGYGRISIKDPSGKIEIPRQSTLIFNVELLRVHNVEPTPPTTPTP
ncbi:MAG TPA: FKBP-type peptidyl-prolyl cis-trans isomerase [Gemmatimonadaceae bacterium]|nr:FKBP-type peptidyl-prolyl cis-trans isomerase [Gemmatimonadaceae bacterium]